VDLLPGRSFRAAGEGSAKLCWWREEGIEARTRILFGDAVQIATLERREQCRRFAWLDEDGNEKIRPVGKRCPL
jgi:hypothetical protein